MCVCVPEAPVACVRTGVYAIFFRELFNCCTDAPIKLIEIIN